MTRLIILFLIVPFYLLAQAPKKYPSLLWKISGNGTKKPSYLYGTMHVSNRVAWHLTEEFFSALKSVDVVGLETHPGDWLENMEKTGELEEISQNPYQNMYRGDFYRSTFSVSFPEKRMLQAILSYDPDIINGLLYRQNKNQENFEEDTYVDLFIFQSASKLNKKIISLEDFAESQIKARLSAIPDEAERTGQNRRRAFNDGTQLEDAYRAGDLDLLDSLNQDQFSNNARRYLLDDRNVFFLNTMDSVLKTSTIFAGVGAAHLPGKNGVIELLRQKGYTVEPVIGKVSKKSSSAREELENKIKPVAFTKQLVNDSAFSMELPGKAYPIADINGLRYYIHPDMTNGVFYTIVRLQHVGPVFHISPRDLLQRVDSLLFESIPGKIISKKEIKANDGTPGLEIVNRTVKGDQQHYKIFFTDLEMLLFKVGGKKEYATSREAERFLNSIQFIPKSEKAVAFSPATGGFSVTIPQKHSYFKKNGSAPIGVVEELAAYDAAKKQYYGVERAVYNDFEYLEEDTFELTRFTKHILENYKFINDKKFTLYKEQTLPAVRFYATDAQGAQLNGKIIIKGVHYYFVYQVADKGAVNETTFIDSFRITDFKHVNDLKEVRDVDFCFKVQDEVSDNASSRFNEAYAKAYQAMAPKKDSVQRNIDFRSATKFYYSPSTNEYVNITFEKFNDYDYRKREELEERIDQAYKRTGMIPRGKKTTFQNGTFTYTVMLCDTATTRALLNQVYFKNGLMHEVSVPFDTTIGLKGWAAGFMKTFAPLDTFTEHTVFTKKFKLLAEHLTGEDTTKKRQAENSFPQVGLHKDYTGDFITLLGSASLNKISEDTRAQLFVTGGTLRDDRIVQPYTKLYSQYTDSFYLQLSLLKGLAYLRSPSGYAAFANLVAGSPPLVGEQASIMDVFSVLHDSLPLCKPLVKEFLKLTRYEEYRDPVYQLLSELVSQKIISPKDYQDQLQTIADDALLTIKRYNPAAESGERSGSYSDRMAYPPTEGFMNYQHELNELSSNVLLRDSVLLSQRPPLVSYGFLLSPYFKKENKAADFFSRLGRVKDPSIVIPVCVELLKYGHQWNDTLVKQLSRNHDTRFPFYAALKRVNLESNFPKEYLNQETLLQSVLISQREQMRSGRKQVTGKDSFALVAKIPVSNKYQSGELYIFKNSADKTDENHWTAFFVNAKGGKVSSQVELVNMDFYSDPRKTQKENLDVLLDHFSVTFRRRALPAQGVYN